MQGEKESFLCALESFFHALQLFFYALESFFHALQPFLHALQKCPVENTRQGLLLLHRKRG